MNTKTSTDSQDALKSPVETGENIAVNDLVLIIATDTLAKVVEIYNSDSCFKKYLLEGHDGFFREYQLRKWETRPKIRYNANVKIDLNQWRPTPVTIAEMLRSDAIGDSEDDDEN